MQEKVIVKENKITIANAISINNNIRPEGEQVKKGELALKKDTKLNPASIGYLSSLGITTVSVYKKPTIAIVSTGNEIIEAHQPLAYGQIYESNSKMLQSALYNLNFYDVSLHKIEDDYIKTYETLKELLNDNDLVLIFGGISVGDYDYVGKALKALEVEELFYKVQQKPGKPLFFGKKEQCLVFALPGNPAAALTCFYVYVYIALQKIMGKTTIELPRIQAKSISVFHKNGDRPQFLKAFYSNDEVTILEGQSSAMLQTFALSNALVFMPENIDNIAVNDLVNVILLPN
ncbi:MAG: molybdopterin molybdotransferase MoeA [Flavobacterium sp.]|nr:molybdopterin molybdotransferase MoeA [Flavobacterium sp.]